MKLITLLIAKIIRLMYVLSRKCSLVVFCRCLIYEVKTRGRCVALCLRQCWRQDYQLSICLTACVLLGSLLHLEVASMLFIMLLNIYCIGKSFQHFISQFPIYSSTTVRKFFRHFNILAYDIRFNLFVIISLARCDKCLCRQ